jgi:hypothetical protein
MQTFKTLLLHFVILLTGREWGDLQEKDWWERMKSQNDDDVEMKR